MSRLSEECEMYDGAYCVCDFEFNSEWWIMSMSNTVSSLKPRTLYNRTMVILWRHVVV